MERDKVAGYVQLEDLMNDEIVIYINEKSEKEKLKKIVNKYFKNNKYFKQVLCL